MPQFTCPVCSHMLNTDGRTMKCENGHSYDISKYGYVNLLMSNQPSEKRHGDDLLMVKSRKSFLEKGYYDILLHKLTELSIKYCSSSPDIIDVGCGECWYTANIASSLCSSGKQCNIAAIDISKDALRIGARRDRSIKTAVASAGSLPFGNESCDLIINLFAPYSEKEFQRVLKDTGVLIRAVPLKRHLFGLKAAIYENPYENADTDFEIAGFSIEESFLLKDTLILNNHDDIINLFKMTPYYYKTGINDQKKIEKLEFLQTEIEFGVFVYGKSEITNDK